MNQRSIIETDLAEGAHVTMDLPAEDLSKYQSSKSVISNRTGSQVTLPRPDLSKGAWQALKCEPDDFLNLKWRSTSCRCSICSARVLEFNDESIIVDIPSTCSYVSRHVFERIAVRDKIAVLIDGDRIGLLKDISLGGISVETNYCGDLSAEKFYRISIPACKFEGFGRARHVEPRAIRLQFVIECHLNKRLLSLLKRLFRDNGYAKEKCYTVKECIPF